MNYPVIWALLATLGTWLTTALGAGVVLFFPEGGRKHLNTMMGFASGVMIAASFWSLLQPAAEQAENGALPPWLVVTAGFLAGAAFLWMTDRCIRLLQEKPSENQSLMLVLSITLHNIPEGLAVGVAFGALPQSNPEALMAAISVAVGVGLQNFPEGAAVSLPLLGEGTSKGKSFFIGQASGIVEPLAGVAGALLVGNVERILPFSLSFAAGAMILVAVHELIPQCQQNRGLYSYQPTGGIIWGFALMTLLDVMLG